MKDWPRPSAAAAHLTRLPLPLPGWPAQARPTSPGSAWSWTAATPSPKSAPHPPGETYPYPGQMPARGCRCSDRPCCLTADLRGPRFGRACVLDGVPERDCHELPGVAVGQQVEALESVLSASARKLLLRDADGAVNTVRRSLGRDDACEHGASLE